MIEKIYDIAKLFYCEGGREYEMLSEIPDRGNGFFIKVNLDESTYQGLEAIESKKFGKKLLFVTVLGNISVNPSPTINLQGDKKSDESDTKKLKSVLNRFIEFFNNDLTKNIYDVLTKNKDNIFKDLKEKPPQERERSILSCLFIKNGKEYLPADLREVVGVFYERQLFSKKESYGRCFLCGKEVESYPQLNEIFKFSTFDKPGFTPMLKRQEEIILSICKECRILLKYARTFIEENLQFFFYTTGDVLWIIPFSEDKELLEGLIKALSEIFSNRQLRKVEKIEKRSHKLSLSKKMGNNLERELSKFVSISYDFVVFHKSNNEEKILMHASEVSPSRLSKIVRESDWLAENLGGGEEVTIGGFLDFFKLEKSKSFGKKVYYELVKAIYENRTFSKDLLLSYMMRWARKNIISVDSSNVVNVIRSCGYKLFTYYIFLIRVGVLKGGYKLGEDSFFEKFSDFFDQPWKKAVFLTGVLTGYLLDYQRKTKNSMPFIKKLKGLKMTKEDVKGLLPEIKAKVLQYRLESKSLDREFNRASQFFLEAGNWNTTVDEINFVFTTGMSMFNRFIRGEQDEQQS